MTALQCLDELAGGSGQVLLVNGATGGVGRFAVQMARQLGYEVIATARAGAEADLMRHLGAAHVIDWAEDELSSSVAGLAPGGVDALVDLISASPEAFAMTVAGVVRTDGAAVTTRGVAVPGASDHRVANVFSRSDRALLERVAVYLAEGVVKPVVTAQFGLHDIERAFGAVSAGACGKVGLNIGIDA